MPETTATVTRADGTLKKQVEKVRDEDGIYEAVIEGDSEE